MMLWWCSLVKYCLLFLFSDKCSWCKQNRNALITYRRSLRQTALCEISGQCTIPGGKVSLRCVVSTSVLRTVASGKNRHQIVVDVWAVDFLLAVHVQLEFQIAPVTRFLKKTSIGISIDAHNGETVPNPPILPAHLVPETSDSEAVTPSIYFSTLMSSSHQWLFCGMPACSVAAIFRKLRAGIQVPGQRPWGRVGLCPAHDTRPGRGCEPVWAGTQRMVTSKGLADQQLLSEAPRLQREEWEPGRPPPLSKEVFTAESASQAFSHDPDPVWPLPVPTEALWKEVMLQSL